MQPNAIQSGNDFDRARQLHATGRLSDAIAIYQQLVAADPHHPDALHLLGVARFQSGSLSEALVLINRALLARPRFPEAHNNLGNVLKAGGQLAAAAASYRDAIRLRPGYAAAHNHLGLVLWEIGDLDAAIDSYREALRVYPDFADALSNLGTALRDQGRLDEAVAAYRQALAINPNQAATHGGLGVALGMLNRKADALEQYDLALGLDPDHLDSHLSRALLLLSLGRFNEGWPEFEWRLRRPGFGIAATGVPEWRGEDLAGRSILISTEQGLGDTIQFIRFAIRLAREGAHVLLLAPAALRPLLQRVPSIELVAEPVDADFHAPLMSLPGRMGVTLDALPSETEYVSADPTRIERWRNLLPVDRLRVGVAWQGNPRAEVDRGRSLPLDVLAPLLALEGVAIVSLQKGPGAEQLASSANGGRIVDPGESLDTDGAFVDTAAIISGLDLVVSTDTAVAHLAGALGLPTFVLLQHVPDWRWLSLRDDSPWYPHTLLFRQTERGDWTSPVARLVTAVAGMRDGSRR